MGVKRVRPVETIVRPFQEFANRASSSGGSVPNLNDKSGVLG
jgi:hypothetical protein